MQDEDSAFSFKDLMTVVPLGAIILAALFDFGSFSAVDKSLFTLFSWSDHIVFALEAVFPAIVIVAAIGWGLSKYTWDAPLKLQPRGRLWFLVVLFAALTLMVILTNGYVGVTVFWLMPYTARAANGTETIPLLVKPFTALRKAATLMRPSCPV